MFVEGLDYTEYDMYQLDDDGLGFAWGALIGGVTTLASSGMNLYSQSRTIKASAKQQKKEYEAQKKLLTQQAEIAEQVEKTAFQRAIALTQTTAKRIPTWIYIAGGSAILLGVILMVSRKRKD